MGRRIKALRDVVNWGLCIGCGACSYACNRGAVSLLNIESSGIRARFDRNSCDACSACLSICPGYRIDANLLGYGLSDADKATHEFGPSLEIWEGFAADPEVRHAASSGGILSALALYCLERENMRSVLHTGMHEDKPWLNKTVQSRNRSDLLARAGSRYGPSSPCESPHCIEESDGPCVFIGKPCDTAAVTMLRRQRNELNQKLGLVLTFFCAGTPSVQGTMDLLNSGGIAAEEVDAIRYRGDGWPRKFKVLYNNRMQEQALPYEESWGRLAEYRPFRCQLCPDGLGVWADISYGDAWHHYHRDGDMGRSLVLVRTHRGKEILHKAMATGYLELVPADANAVLAAQTNLLRRRKHLFGRLFAMKLLLVPTLRFTGFFVFRSWARLPFLTKCRTILGTLRRLMLRGLWRRRPYHEQATDGRLENGPSLMPRKG